MREKPLFNRRDVLSYSLGVGTGVAATAGLAACSPGGPSPTGHGASGPVDVKSFGAVGDGEADDTAAVAAAVKSAKDHVVLYFPPGVYRMTSFPELPDFATVTGAGADLSTLRYDKDGVLIKLRGRHRVAFARLGVCVTSRGGAAVQISNSFRCSFDAVTLRGNHLGSNFPQYQSQRGLVLDENSGGTALINCDINNFGVGLTTRCIQNYVTNCKFTNNRISVLGTGDDYNAGLAIMNTEFVSDTDEKTTGTHLRIDGAANDWFLTNVWFEGCDVAADIGSSDGGPAQFGVVNAKIAARKTGITFRHCRQPYLANVSFDHDAGRADGATALSIDADGCPQGTASGLISGTSDDIPLTVFPPDWNVSCRHGKAGGRILTPMTMRAPAVSESQEAAPVLADADGGYWQLVVDASGALTTRPLGKTPPK